MSQKKGEEKPAELSVDVLDVAELSRVAQVDAKAVNAGLYPVQKLRNRGTEEC